MLRWGKPYYSLTHLLCVPEMIENVKVTDEEILAMWEETCLAGNKAVSLATEAKMFHAQAEYHKMRFWQAVGEKYNINTSSYAWAYDTETQTVTRHKEEEHPLAKLFSGLGAPSSDGISLDKDDSGTVI